ncbi:synaptic vesicle glycoprotein 2C-like isoform X2 [Mercenaria mercenaria]|uniref:synaptic vesicle glycoprotein 2C-like isoform X2 n=1 Tax=Mercenaria mercenaria TaxID=6596 RepID=UPI00234ED033|nr:synaptic vesicle glycoprotein 2C-like isoform X2 [Mercenaria mercenaria]
MFVHFIFWEKMDNFPKETDPLLFYDIKKKDSGEEPVPYEAALKSIGYGRFHIILLALCGWAVSSDAIEVLSVSFMLPSAQCDLKLSSQDKGWLNAIIFVGMMVGGYFWGSMADKFGRRSVLMGSLTVNGLGGLVSSTSQVFWLFLIMRFISGVGVGGSIPVIFSYFTEFLPKDRRGTMISALATFWMMGNIIAAGLAWAVIPHPNLGYFSEKFTYNSWRIFVAICTIPSLTSAAMFVFMPESPKYFLTMGKEKKALDSLRTVSRINGRDRPFQISRLILTKDRDGIIHLDDDEEKTNFKESAKHLLHQTQELFGKTLLRTTTIMIIINFTLSFGYYGLWMWFPEIFSRVEKYGGSVCSHPHINETASNTTEPCNGIPEEWVFFEGFMTALSNLPGNILTILIMDKVGRKPLLSTSMVLAGVTVFFLPIVHSKVHNLLISCAFGAVTTVGWNSIDVLQAELFPTAVRSTAFGVQSGVGRIAAILGNVSFGSLVDVHCAVPMIMVSVLLTIGGLSAIKLPNTTGKDIH